ncbi:unnamed protein product [Closterium sp. NIES-54]
MKRGVEECRGSPCVSVGLNGGGAGEDALGRHASGIPAHHTTNTHANHTPRRTCLKPCACDSPPGSPCVSESMEAMQGRMLSDAMRVGSQHVTSHDEQTRTAHASQLAAHHACRTRWRRCRRGCCRTPAPRPAPSAPGSTAGALWEGESMVPVGKGREGKGREGKGREEGGGVEGGESGRWAIGCP